MAPKTKAKTDVVPTIGDKTDIGDVNVLKQLMARRTALSSEEYDRVVLFVRGNSALRVAYALASGENKGSLIASQLWNQAHYIAADIEKRQLERAARAEGATPKAITITLDPSVVAAAQ